MEKGQFNQQPAAAFYRLELDLFHKWKQPEGRLSPTLVVDAC